MAWRKLSEIELTPTRFLWHPFLPLGVISILEGPPGALKTTLLSDIAGRVSSGKSLPSTFDPSLTRNSIDQPPSTSGKRGVIILAGEDQPSRIRLGCEAAGADLERIVLFERCELVEQLPTLKGLVQELDARLLIIDPLSDFVDRRLTDERIARDAIEPLRSLASEYNLSVVIVRHLAKSNRTAISAGLGSIALTGVARSVMLATQHPNSAGNMILSLTKSNVAAPIAISYAPSIRSTEGVVQIDWGSVESNLDSDTLLKTIDKVSRNALKEATDFLCGVLDEGPVAVQEIKRNAKRNGFSWATVRRAKYSMRIKSTKHGGGASQFWVWSLPDSTNELENAAKDREIELLTQDLIDKNGESSSFRKPTGEALGREAGL